MAFTVSFMAKCKSLIVSYRIKKLKCTSNLFKTANATTIVCVVRLISWNKIWRVSISDSVRDNQIFTLCHDGPCRG